MPGRQLRAIHMRPRHAHDFGLLVQLLAATRGKACRAQRPRGLFALNNDRVVDGLLDLNTTKAKPRLLPSPEDEDVLDFMPGVLCMWLGCPKRGRPRAWQQRFRSTLLRVFVYKHAHDEVPSQSVVHQYPTTSPTQVLPSGRTH